MSSLQKPRHISTLPYTLSQMQKSLGYDGKSGLAESYTILPRIAISPAAAIRSLLASFVLGLHGNLIINKRTLVLKGTFSTRDV